MMDPDFFWYDPFTWLAYTFMVCAMVLAVAGTIWVLRRMFQGRTPDAGP